MQASATRRAASASSCAGRERASEESAVRAADLVGAGAARLPPPGDRRGSRSRCWRFTKRPARRRSSGFDARHPARAPAAAHEPASSWSGIERDPGRRRRHAHPTTAISDLELASRLSFFLWSSIPDEELLKHAERQQARRIRPCCAQQVRRMLADDRSQALVSNFAGQWLYLRNVPRSQARHAAVPRLRREPAPGAPAARPSCCSRRSCARIGARSISSAHGIRSSTSGSRATTAFRTSTAAISGASRCPPTSARRAARTGQHPDGDVVPEPDVSRAARQVDPREHPRRAAAAAAA